MTNPPHPGHPFFAAIGDRLGRSYLRYSFAHGTDQEVDFLASLLGRAPGSRVLDVGCGPGRHSVALARRGVSVTGVDVSGELLAIAAEDARAAGVPASFFEVDARQMPFDDEFEFVLSLAGAFGFMGDDDPLVLRRMAEAARPGGSVVVTVANAYFVALNRPPNSILDADRGMLYEKTTIRPGGRAEQEAELWTNVYTPRELRLLAVGVGLVPRHVWSVEPGGFGRRDPGAELPELMLVATKPATHS